MKNEKIKSLESMSVVVSKNKVTLKVNVLQKFILNCPFSLEGAAVMKLLSSWLAQRGVWGFIPGLTDTISKIGYLLFPSCNMTVAML